MGCAGPGSLDIGIICSQAAGHLVAAGAEVLGAAEEYARSKCSREEVERRCGEAGIVFQPMIFESLGGVPSEADGVIKCLNQAVAENTDSPAGEVATRFWQRVSIDLQRAGHRALSRRLGSGLSRHVGMGLGSAYRDNPRLEAVGGV